MQDSTYHNLCYITCGALAGTEIVNQSTKRDRSNDPHTQPLNYIFPYFIVSFLDLDERDNVCHNSMVTAFAHGAMVRRIDPSWGEPTELFLVPASAPRLV